MNKNAMVKLFLWFAFENASGDFKNDYRFMSKEVVEEKTKKGPKFKGVNWDIT